jgi:hypothetical protein
VPPPDSPEWEVPATAWLLDHCPADYRGYEGWRKHPVALAWVTTRHIEAQLEAMRGAYRDVRVDLGDLVPAEALPEILADLEAEGLRLRAAARSAGLLYDALQGRRYIPRL